jgi:hypothetical protein
MDALPAIMTMVLTFFSGNCPANGGTAPDSWPTHVQEATALAASSVVIKACWRTRKATAINANHDQTAMANLRPDHKDDCGFHFQLAGTRILAHNWYAAGSSHISD